MWANLGQSDRQMLKTFYWSVHFWNPHSSTSAFRLLIPERQGSLNHTGNPWWTQRKHNDGDVLHCSCFTELCCIDTLSKSFTFREEWLHISSGMEDDHIWSTITLLVIILFLILNQTICFKNFNTFVQTLLTDFHLRIFIESFIQLRGSFLFHMFFQNYWWDL